MTDPKQTELPIVHDALPLGTEGLSEQGKLQAMAIQTGNVETLERLIALQERNDANNARKAYHAAMTAFKANPPKIVKDKLVSYGETSYMHADLGRITEIISAALSPHDLSASWITGQAEKGISVSCTITHALGHSESTTLTASADSSGKKNSIQAIGSTVSYLQRYTLLALTGLAAKGQDDDAQTAEAISLEEYAPLRELFDNLDEEKQSKFNAWLDKKGIDSLGDIPKHALASVDGMLRRVSNAN